LPLEKRTIGSSLSDDTYVILEVHADQPFDEWLVAVK
jgi:hypothetical protein